MLFSKEDLRKLIVPLVIEQLLAVTIGMADTMMVANVGRAAVSGISLVDSLNIPADPNFLGAGHGRCGRGFPISGPSGSGKRLRRGRSSWSTPVRQFQFW